ncbi:MAG: SRPBCC family protein [Candidatus Rokubacteria bacterium]|nr:SRPBCC family protein [Candidatus Rokubacteria bacterium]
MADHVLDARLWVGRPRPDVFAFFADPANLARLTPPSYRLRLVRPVVMATGAVLDYELRWLGAPIRWRAFVREYDPPYRFLDVQLRGPYTRWEHRHRFLDEDGGTVIEDHVVYRLPLGGLGRMAHAALVGRQLRAAWDYRTRQLAALLGPVRPAA